ncbi:MAG: putative ABC transporter permease [Velocimicrobium sp.]
MWNSEIMGFDFYFLFYNFFLYCFFGWIYESCLVSFRKKTLVNRGFLNGPILPIYGAGATIVYILIYPIQQNAFLVFICGAVLATILEYVTSYLMEKVFHAKWWDYTHYKYNIKGRICLLASLVWGILSIFMTEVLQPVMDSLINQIPRNVGELAGVPIFVLFSADVTVTVIYALKLDQKFVDLAKTRDEILEYLESTKLFGATGEIKGRLEELSIASLSESFKGQIDAKRSQLPNKDELEQKLKTLLSKYQKSAELKNIVQKRILRAFPTMKSMRSEKILEDLRKKRK